MKSLALRIVVTGLLSHAILSACQAQDLYDCGRPLGMPAIPNGLTATTTEMANAQAAVESFLLEGEAFIECLSEHTGNPVAAAVYDRLLSEMDLATERYNQALCAYSGGADCIGAAEEEIHDAEAVGFRAPASAAPIVLSDQNFDAIRSEESQSSEFGDSLSEILDPSRDSGPILEPLLAADINRAEELQLAEPTLPDGTPCGSVTQTRNEVDGEGETVRAHYTWEIYNDCFDPIYVRWSFRGDGLLNSEHVVPARGLQILGCSTRRGRVSSRRCSGGFEYIFSWQPQR